MLTPVLGDVVCCASAVTCSLRSSCELATQIQLCAGTGVLHPGCAARFEDQEGMGLSRDPWPLNLRGWVLWCPCEIDVVWEIWQMGFAVRFL